jgi:hypothetical protein
MKHLKWATHMLTAEHKKQCVQFSKGLLKTIAAEHRESWSHFTTGDKNCFYLSIDYETIWLQEREEKGSSGPLKFGDGMVLTLKVANF